MRRTRRHAVVLIQAPEGWTPQSATDIPPASLLQADVTLAEAGGIARRFNAAEIDSPTGRWAIAAKDLRKKRGAT